MPFLKKPTKQGVKRKLRRAALVAGITAAAVPFAFSAIREPRMERWPEATIKSTLAQTEKHILAKYPCFKFNPELVKVLSKPRIMAINAFAEAECKKQGTNYNFLWALTRQESFWDTLAVSSTNAKGMMQINEITLRDLKQRGTKVRPFRPTEAIQGAIKLIKVHEARLEKMKFYHDSRLVDYRQLPEHLRYEIQAEAYYWGITYIDSLAEKAIKKKKDISRLITPYGREITRFMREKEAYDLLLPIYRLSSDSPYYSAIK